MDTRKQIEALMAMFDAMSLTSVWITFAYHQLGQPMEQGHITIKQARSSTLFDVAISIRQPTVVPQGNVTLADDGAVVDYLAQAFNKGLLQVLRLEADY